MAKNTTIKSKNGKDYEYFRITRTIGYRYKEGKKVPIKKQFTGSSEKDAKQKYKKWMLSNTEEPVFDSTKTFGELAEFYTDNILAINSRYALSTRDQYTKSYERYVKDSDLNDIIMSELTAEDVQKYYNNLDISYSAMSMLHKYMRGFMQWQSRNKYGAYLLDSIVIPEKQKNINHEGIVTWMDKEIKTILNSEPDYVLKPLIIFALYSGMRISELLGLKYGDIKDDIIHVRRQYYRGEWVPPKENKSRTIPVHPEIKKLLNERHDPDELIFKSSNGTPLDLKNTNRSLDRFYNRIGIKHKKFHAYRATFITNLCRKEIPIQTVSKLAGHENINVTAKYYAAVNMKDMLKAVKKL